MKHIKKIFFIVTVIFICVVIFFAAMNKEHENHFKSITLSDNYQRISYLNLQGLDVIEISEETIRLPEKFEGIYNDYLIVQQKQKLPLEEYKGKTVKRYLYEIKNYNQENVLAELLIYNNTLIAAAKIQQSQSGFIQGIY